MQSSGANLSSDTAGKSFKDIIKGSNFLKFSLVKARAGSFLSPSQKFVLQVSAAMFKATCATNSNNDL